MHMRRSDERLHLLCYRISTLYVDIVHHVRVAVPQSPNSMASLRVTHESVK